MPCVFYFLDLLEHALCPSIWCTLEKILHPMGGICFVKILDIIFCRDLLHPFDLWDELTSVSLLGFNLTYGFSDESVILKSPTTVVSRSNYPLMSNSPCFMMLYQIYLQVLYLLDRMFLLLMCHGLLYPL